MKGDDRVIELLNHSLTEEFQAITQYMLYASVLAHKGHNKLAALIREDAVEEMHHAEKLMNRILKVEGQPILGRTEIATLEDEPAAIFAKLLAVEKRGISLYRDLIEAAQLARDFISARLGEEILLEEEKHQDWLETQLELIERLGFANYEANLSI